MASAFPTEGPSAILRTMTDAEPLQRSPEMMSRHDTGLLVVDVQEKLLPAIFRSAEVLWNTRRLVDAAHILDIPIAATEQYPRGLGPTVAQLAERLGDIPDKLTFSCRSCGDVFRAFSEQAVRKLLVAGIEAHVCVQQTVLDLLGEGFSVFVAVDAVGSRRELDYRTSLARMDSAGAVLTTAEAAIFELCDTADAPEFRQLSALVKEPPPVAGPSHA